MNELFNKKSKLYTDLVKRLLQTVCPCSPTPKFLCWNSNHNVAVLGGGAFEKGNNLMTGIIALFKETLQNPLVASSMRNGHQETGYLWPR